MALPAIAPQPGIMEIALYEAGSSTLSGRSDVLKLSSNENPFGPSDKAREAVARAAHQMHRYPSTDHAALRAAIAEVHGLDPDRIICGVGSDEIIHFLCQSYAGPGTEVLFTEHGFLMYRISAMAAGATPVEARERERTTDIDAMIARGRTAAADWRALGAAARGDLLAELREAGARLVTTYGSSETAGGRPRNP